MEVKHQSTQIAEQGFQLTSTSKNFHAFDPELSQTHNPSTSNEV